MKILNKKLLYGYSLVALFLSAYINKISATLIEFLLLSLVTLACFIGIYFLVYNFKSVSKFKKALIVLGILMLFIFIYFFSVISYFSGFNSMSCYNIKAKNIFTGTEKIYCNFPPWYTNIVEIKIGTDNKKDFFPLLGNTSIVCERYNFDSLQRYCKRLGY